MYVMCMHDERSTVIDCDNVHKFALVQNSVQLAQEDTILSLSTAFIIYTHEHTSTKSEIRLLLLNYMQMLKE